MPSKKKISNQAQATRKRPENTETHQTPEPALLFPIPEAIMYCPLLLLLILAGRHHRVINKRRR
jgi:hypothetical protein